MQNAVSDDVAFTYTLTAFLFVFKRFWSELPSSLFFLEHIH